MCDEIITYCFSYYTYCISLGIAALYLDFVTSMSHLHHAVSSLFWHGCVVGIVVAGQWRRVSVGDIRSLAAATCSAIFFGPRIC